MVAMHKRCFFLFVLLGLAVSLFFSVASAMQNENSYQQKPQEINPCVVIEKTSSDMSINYYQFLGTAELLEVYRKLSLKRNRSLDLYDQHCFDVRLYLIAKVIKQRIQEDPKKVYEAALFFKGYWGKWLSDLLCEVATYMGKKKELYGGAADLKIYMDVLKNAVRDGECKKIEVLVKKLSRCFYLGDIVCQIFSLLVAIIRDQKNYTDEKCINIVKSFLSKGDMVSIMKRCNVSWIEKWDGFGIDTGFFVPKIALPLLKKILFEIRRLKLTAKVQGKDEVMIFFEDPKCYIL